MSEYPSDRKKSGYAIRYIKALTSSDAIRSVGMEPVLLCVFIASREDRLHYSKPPQFWRAELMERLGIGSPKALVRIRKAAVDAGLLHHIEGDRIQPGKYWTLVPSWLLPTFEAFRKRNGKRLTRSENGTGSGTANGTANGTLSITQYPVPSTGDKRPRFKPPTVEEVQAYAQEIQFSGLDAAYFCDYYQARGWKLKNGPMKDWKAAVRTWERNGVQQAPQAPRKPITPIRKVTR